MNIQASTSKLKTKFEANELPEDFDDTTNESWINDLILETSRKTQSDLISQLDASSDDFDRNAGSSWIFPIGYQKREYQFSISQTCLFNNTLVCLPTGLGKTFIASVVIYNFFRWFPRSKIIFMAHSRPLVNQQIEACYNVVGIPATDSCELTGKLAKDKRMQLWNTKRVFFATPQVIQNDIRDERFPVKSIKLIIVDEAHKAKGKFSYCEVVKEVYAVHKNFRVVALSATPGRTDDVVEVVKNLLISKIEARSENSIDVAKYTFKKEFLVERVYLGDLEIVRDNYMTIIDPYLRKLVEARAISGNSINKGYLVLQQKRFASESAPNKSEIMSCFSIVISLVHALDLLERHNIYSFLDSFRDEGNSTKRKYFVAQDRQLMKFLDELYKKYQDSSPLNLNVNPLPNGIIPDIPADLNFGHPKFEVLREKISEYFNSGGTKTIIFCEYRDTVKLVFTMLLQLRPLVLPRMLMGQSGSISQKDQLTVMKDFRSNKVNALVTTSVCEEGIDVGEVDLVICFDINNKNSTRFVQRIGRTGRKRKGKVLMLTTVGREEDTVRDVMGAKAKLNKSLTTSNQIKEVLFKNSPRLIPANILPKCIEAKFKIPAKIEDEMVEKEAKKKVKKDKKMKSFGTTSIASHFEKVLKREKKLEIETLADIAPDPVIPEFSIKEKFEILEKNFKDQLTKIFVGISSSANENLLSYLKWKTEQDFLVFGKMTKVFHDRLSDDEKKNLVDLNFDFLDCSYEEILHLKSVQSAVVKQEEKRFDNVEDHQPTFTYESRYGNQFSIPEPFNTPFKASPIFNPMNKMLNSTTFNTPITSTSTPLTTKKGNRRTSNSTSIDDSPLIRAFQRQQQQQNKSTPKRESIPSKSTNESFYPSENLQNGSIVECSIIEPSITSSMAATENIFNRRRRRQRRKCKEQQSALEFFNLKSIDDIFGGISVDENATPDIFVDDDIVMQTQQQQSDRKPRTNFFEDDNDDDLVMQIPEISGDDEIIESSLSPKQIERSLPPLTPTKSTTNSSESKKSRKRENIKLDFNIDEIFGNAPSNYDKNSTQQQQQKENQTFTSLTSSSLTKTTTQIVNPVIIDVTSPKKSPGSSLKPNFARLTRALRSPNFLSPTATISKSQTLKSNPINDISAAQLSRSFSSPQGHPKKSPNNFLSPFEANQSPTVTPILKKSRKRPRRDFFDTQAGVDGSQSEDEDESDGSLVDFIEDNTIVDSDHGDDMQARYLKSLQSPSARQNGRFKIPQLPSTTKSFMIFSQDPHLDDDEDDDDEDLQSFIVSNTQENPINETLDELEIAEKLLEEKRKNAKRLKNGIKRRKIIRPTDSSSSDDD